MPLLINLLWIAAALAAALAAVSLLAHQRRTAPELVVPIPEMPPPPLPERYRCRRWHVLVVTPRALVGRQIARMLQGDEVTIATSPQAALAAVASAREIDVILYTLAMPGLSGFDLAAHHPGVVLMIERTTSPELRRKLAGSGVPWIELPLRYAELASAIDFAARSARDLRIHVGDLWPPPVEHVVTPNSR